jgi:hypothetical protein
LGNFRLAVSFKSVGHNINHQSSIIVIMPIGKTTEESTRTGVYHVKESGLEFEHLRSETCPKDGKEYLERFR